jgi:hypothetical protein
MTATATAVRAMGMAWYRPEDYRRIVQIMADGHKLPLTYDRWLQLAERGECDLKRKGLIVVRAMIDAGEFERWCRERGAKLDADGRMKYAAWVARRQVKETH